MKSIPEALQTLRERGLRRTPQRIAVLQVLHENPTHPSAEEICQAARARIPMLSLATVYNILKVLAAASAVRALSCGDGRFRYDARLDPHGHFNCRTCGNIIDIEADFIPEGEIDGHLIQGCQVQFFGVCAACRLPASV
jgi:Fur family peroxide stress response transcriptional regulator